MSVLLNKNKSYATVYAVRMIKEGKNVKINVYMKQKNPFFILQITFLFHTLLNVYQMHGCI